MANGQDFISSGNLQIQVINIRNNFPIQNAKVSISSKGEPERVLEQLTTDSSGQTENISLPAPPEEYSLEPGIYQPYSEYDVLVEAEGFKPLNISGTEILAGTQAIQPAALTGDEGGTPPEDPVVIPDHTLFGNYPPKIAEAEVKPVNESGEIVLSRVVVPQTIVVHDGAPTDSTAKDYYVPYRDYIKNVASSEIYATWPDAAIRANILAIMSFTLNRGDVLGLTGLLGSGRGEIGQALFGLTPAESGRIVLNGKEITIKSVNDAMANDIGYVPEDRLTQGLFMDRSIQDNTVASSIRKYMKGGKLDEQAMETVTRRWIDEINIVAPSPKPAVRTLSGGNAQKVVIAKWLNTDPKLFILDGPTVGVDIGAKAEIHAILRDLAQKGIGIIVISDDLPELVQNCNKIIVMRDGKVEAAVDNSIDELSLSNLLIGASDAAKSAAQTTEQEVEEK